MYFNIKNKYIKCLILNQTMISGKKNKSEYLFNYNIKNLNKYSFKNIYFIIKYSIKNVSPILSILKIKKRKSLIQIPFFLNKSKRLNYSIKSIASNSFNNKNNFYKDIINLCKNKGVIKDKQKDIFINTFTNRNFTHFRWF